MLFFVCLFVFQVCCTFLPLTGLKNGVCVRELISTWKRSEAGNDWSYILTQSSQARKEPPAVCWSFTSLCELLSMDQLVVRWSCGWWFFSRLALKGGVYIHSPVVWLINGWMDGSTDWPMNWLTLQGGIYVVQLFDTYAAPISILLVVFLEAVAVNWIYGKLVGSVPKHTISGLIRNGL